LPTTPADVLGRSFDLGNVRENLRVRENGNVTLSAVLKTRTGNI